MLTSTDTGWQNTGLAVGAPAHYVDFTFTPAANTPYRVWLRLRAKGGSKYNDSVFVQFSNAADLTGKPRYRVGSTDSLIVNLQSCNGCALDGWGWIGGAYWVWQVNPLYFLNTSSQTLRVQTREDGVEIDQIVLSPVTYLNTAPGPVTGDTTTLPCQLPTVSTPRSVPAPIPGTIAAAEFDEGGPAVAYHDTTIGNSGNVYRSTNVDLQIFNGGTPTVGWIAPGEWLNYTVDVAAAGVYELEARVASSGQGGLFHVNFSDNNATGALRIPDTAGWSNWTNVRTLVTLDAGVQMMKVLFDTQAAAVGNLASIRLIPHVATPYNGSTVTVPGAIRPEQFDLAGAALSYFDTTPGNSGGAYRDSDVDIVSSGAAYAVTSIDAGEWLEYGITVTRSMDYVIEFDVASTVDTGRVRAQFASASTPQIGIPNTGGNWATIAVPIALTAGDQIMRLSFDGGGFSLRAMRVQRQPKTLVVAPGGSVQSAIDAAELGDTVVLEAGVTYVGNFVLRAKNGDGYVTIRSSAPDAMLPGEGVRIDPSYAPHLPKLRSPNSMPAIATEASAHHYRLQFVEFLANGQGLGSVIALGDGSKMQNTLDLVPHDFIVDRVYIHGDVTLGQKRAIALNSAATTIVNSYISEIKAAGQDSQAIGGWNGPGPYVISNNYLEAAGENVMFGGADPAIPGLVPSDITFTGNHLFKPLSWRGSKWTVKNLFELKNAQRVVVDGNLMENNWAAAQSGYAILLKSVNQDGTAPWSVVQDVELTNNVVRHVSSGINILGRDQTFYPSVQSTNITIRNNVFEDVSAVRYGGVGRLLLINGGDHVTFTHNTAFNDGSTTLFGDGLPTTGFVFNDNIVVDNAYGIKGSGTGVGNGTIATYFPGGQFVGGLYIGAKASLYPTANSFPVNAAAVGFVDYANGDYRLAETSLYFGRATDGTNPGADIAALAGAYGAVRR